MEVCHSCQSWSFRWKRQGLWRFFVAVWNGVLANQLSSQVVEIMRLIFLRWLFFLPPIITNTCRIFFRNGSPVLSQLVSKSSDCVRATNYSQDESKPFIRDVFIEPSYIREWKIMVVLMSFVQSNQKSIQGWGCVDYGCPCNDISSITHSSK